MRWCFTNHSLTMLPISGQDNIHPTAMRDDVCVIVSARSGRFQPLHREPLTGPTWSSASGTGRSCVSFLRSRGISSETLMRVSLSPAAFTALMSKISLVSLTETGFNFGLEVHASLRLTAGDVDSRENFRLRTISRSERDDSLNSVVSISWSLKSASESEVLEGVGGFSRLLCRRFLKRPGSVLSGHCAPIPFLAERQKNALPFQVCEGILLNRTTPLQPASLHVSSNYMFGFSSLWPVKWWKTYSMFAIPLLHAEGPTSWAG